VTETTKKIPSPPRFLFDVFLYSHCPENISFDLKGIQMLSLLSATEVQIFPSPALESRYRSLFPSSDAL